MFVRLWNGERKTYAFQRGLCCCMSFGLGLAGLGAAYVQARSVNAIEVVFPRDRMLS